MSRKEFEDLEQIDADKLKKSKMRRFVLMRKEDVSGVSGTGVVAEGVVFTSGFVAFTWLSPMTVVSTAPSLDCIENVHGHEGSTEVVYLDD